MSTASPLSSLIRAAIKAALENAWEEAVEYNLKILEQDSRNLDALNRLTQAYRELAKPKLALAAAKKVLQLDRYNPIAKKNLQRLTARSSPTASSGLISPQLFLEEPGITKTVTLTKVTGGPLLQRLNPGQLVNLVPKVRTITVTTPEGAYLGSLPDDLAHRLLKLVRQGNHYLAFIRRLKQQQLTIMIRETFRSKRFSTPSFPPPSQSPTLKP